MYRLGEYSSLSTEAKALVSSGGRVCNAYAHGNVCQRKEGEITVGLIRINYSKPSG
jgi:hypothetical protein